MKIISVIMSFVAVLSATVVLILAIHHHNVAKSSAETIVAKPDVKPTKAIRTSDPQAGQLVMDKPPPVVIPPPPVPREPLPSVPEPPSVPPAPEPSKPEVFYDPNSSVTWAVGDLLTFPKHDQKYIRYISLYNIPRERRREYAAVISFVVNSLGTRRKMYIPEFVGASNETLIRLDIRNYEWTFEAWEKLGLNGSGVRPSPEPYFHYIIDKPILEKVKRKKIQKVEYTDGSFRDEEVEVEEVVATKRRLITEIAPWLDKIGNQALYDLTCSHFPIFRADWFIANVIVPPAYYDFLRLGNKAADFDKLIFADEELARKARSQDKAVVIASIVARNNRTLNRSPTFTSGYVWKSHDSLKSVDNRDYVKFILDENFDATEDIGSLPNGLQAYFLTDGKGNRLDVANPDIAIDFTAADKLVRTGRSCMICHSDGIRPISDEIRTLTRTLQNPKQVQLLVSRKEDAYRIEDLFSSDLDEQIIKDQNYYRAAVARATGLQSEVIAKLLNEIYNNYIERLMTIDDIARDVGIEVNNLEPFIKASKDNVVLGLLKTPIRPIRRDQWEFSYSRFTILIHARRQGLDHADPYPPGPLIELPKKHE
jgi:hypothetical protein